jgi:hypothetical protein
MTIIFGLLLLALLFLTPLYFVGLIVYYWRKKQRPGTVAWVVNPLVAFLWVVCVIIMIVGTLRSKSASQITSANPPAAAAPAAPTTDQASSDAPTGAHGTPTVVPTPPIPGWDDQTDGATYIKATEDQKQQWCAAAAALSTQQHTAAFFYTNLNEYLNPSNTELLKIPLAVHFIDFDSYTPDKSYPPMLGFSWARIQPQSTPQGDVKVIYVLWQDGHSFIHNQKIQPNGSYVSIGPDGPWDGDAATYTATTTVVGNNFTIAITGGGNPSTRNGAFQVSTDGSELDITENGHTVRYSLVAQLVKNIDDIGN